ncbi:hypothetical protein ACT9XH_08680 [Methanococcoides methylutens]|uniref:hypothetical protein n=1 Tax=Methanococcoides methylutens TaxID=2226 RepID=UPI004043EA99
MTVLSFLNSGKSTHYNDKDENKNSLKICMESRRGNFYHMKPIAKTNKPFTLNTHVGEVGKLGL